MFIILTIRPEDISASLTGRDVIPIMAAVVEGEVEQLGPRRPQLLLVRLPVADSNQTDIC